MDVCAQRQGGTPDDYRFVFDGNRIVDTATPDDVRAKPLPLRVGSRLFVLGGRLWGGLSSAPGGEEGGAGEENRSNCPPSVHLDVSGGRVMEPIGLGRWPRAANVLPARPAQLEMEDDDVIDAMLEQTGGCF